jgi:thiamine-phosphate pyrophosphorylase
MRGFYFITDALLSRAGNVSDVKQALAAKVRVVQFRDKESPPEQLREEALRLRRLCQGALFLVNDRVDLALEVDADGVHLGQDDLPYGVARKMLGKDKIIGLTVHNLREALEAARLGADYLGVSPIFPTRTKADAGAAAGLELIREIRRRVALPLIAIGGITLNNALEVVRAGAHGLCAISAVVTRPDVRAAIAKFQELFGHEPKNLAHLPAAPSRRQPGGGIG